MFCKIYLNDYFITFCNDNKTAITFNMDNPYWRQTYFCHQCYLVKTKQNSSHISSTFLHLKRPFRCSDWTIAACYPLYLESCPSTQTIKGQFVEGEGSYLALGAARTWHWYYRTEPQAWKANGLRRRSNFERTDKFTISNSTLFPRLPDVGSRLLGEKVWQNLA